MRQYLLIVCFCLGLLLTGCAGDDDDPEDAVDNYLISRQADCDERNTEGRSWITIQYHLENLARVEWCSANRRRPPAFTIPVRP